MTSDQETRVLAMLAAFEAGKKISDLDTASGSVRRYAHRGAGRTESPKL